MPGNLVEFVSCVTLWEIVEPCGACAIMWYLVDFQPGGAAALRSCSCLETALVRKMTDLVRRCLISLVGYFLINVQIWQFSDQFQVSASRTQANLKLQDLS